MLTLLPDSVQKVVLKAYWVKPLLQCGLGRWADHLLEGEPREVALPKCHRLTALDIAEDSHRRIQAGSLTYPRHYVNGMQDPGAVTVLEMVEQGILVSR